VASRIAEWLMMQMMTPLVGQMDRWEERLVATPGMHRALPGAPVRFEIMNESIKRGKAQMEPELSTIMPGILTGMRASMISLRRNPDEPMAQVLEGFLDEFESYARTLGVSSIGYTRVPEKWIFEGKGSCTSTPSCSRWRWTRSASTPPPASAASRP